MSIHHVTPFLAQQESALLATQRFIQEHCDGLLNAAAMLGGPKAHSRCLKLYGDIASAARLTRRLRCELVWLHRLLVLDFVGDLDAEETACFMQIDLCDPRVEETCLSADTLFELLVEISDLHPECDVIAGELFNFSAA